MSTRKVILTALFVAIGIVLPQTIHAFGGPLLGATLLPMHLSVFIGAMLLGPVSGIIIAVLSVGVGFMFGMPPILIASYMIFELIVYAFVSGWLFYKLKVNVFLSYFIAKISGMAVAILALLIMMNLFLIDFPPAFGTIAMFYPGVIGIVLQIFIIPSTVLILRKELKKHERLS